MSANRKNKIIGVQPLERCVYHMCATSRLLLVCDGDNICFLCVLNNQNIKKSQQKHR